MRIILLAISFLFLSGCSAFQEKEIVYVNREIKVPVIVYKEIPFNEEVPPPSVLPLENIDEETNYEDAAKYYIESISLLLFENAQLREALKPYQNNALEEETNADAQ